MKDARGGNIEGTVAFPLVAVKAYLALAKGYVTVDGLRAWPTIQTVPNISTRPVAKFLITKRWRDSRHLCRPIGRRILLSLRKPAQLEKQGTKRSIWQDGILGPGVRMLTRCHLLVMLVNLI